MSKRPASPTDEQLAGPRKMSKVDQPGMFPNSKELGNLVEEVIETSLQRLTLGQHLCTAPGHVYVHTSVADHDWMFRLADVTPEASKFSLKIVPKFFSTNWSLKASTTVTFRSKTDNDRKIERTFRDITFRHDNLELVFEVENEHFENMYDEELEEFHGVYGLHSPVTLNLRIQVVHSVGLRPFRTVVYNFGKPRENSDCMLVLDDDKKIFVDLGYLCQHSDYFACLLRRKSELPIDKYSNLPFETISDVDYDEFSKLLHVIYPSKYTFNDAGVHFLLPLADRFLFEGLLSDIEKYLASPDSKGIDVLTKLQWSFQYQMASLQAFALAQLNTHESIRELRQNPNYNNMSPEVVKCLLDRATDLTLPAVAHFNGSPCCALRINLDRRFTNLNS